MLSIGALSAGHQKYFSKLANPDYYLAGGEPEGHWFGKGAEALGRNGKITPRDFNEMFLGYVDGRPLVQNAGRDDRQCAWDHCFSMPKSGSVAFALFPELREEIRRCQDDSVKYALSEVEDTILFSRKGKGGREHVHAKMVAALFEHCCSRAEDPQLHTHCLVMNVGVQQDGTRALISKPLYDHKMRIGALYRSKLAELFEQRLGFKCKTVETWFEIEGIPKELCDLFSTRRKEVVAKLGELGLESASAAAYATLGTRKPKTLVPPRAELFQRWQRQAREYGFDIDQVFNRQNELTPQPQKDPSIQNEKTAEPSKLKTVDIEPDRPESKQIGHSHEIDDQSNVDNRHISPGQPAEPGCPNTPTKSGPPPNRPTPVSEPVRGLNKAVDRIQRRSSLFETSSLYINQAIRKYSKPRSTLEAEIDYHLGQFKKALNHKKTKKIDRDLVKRQAKQYLDRNEAELVRGITSNHGPLQIVNISDLSSENKVLKVCNEIWEKANMDVWGFSLSRSGATLMQEESGIRTRSFRAFELMRSPTLKYRVKYTIKQLVSEALLSRSYPLRPFNTEKKVLVVNQAHRLNMDQMDELLQAVNKCGGRIVLLGSTDLREEKFTAFDHVAYRASRNDCLQVRKDYLSLISKPTLTPENERKEP